MSPRPQDAPPARAPWPPILIALSVLGGLALDRLSGGGFSALVSFPGAPILGGLIVALALANDIWCASVFARHKTTIMPHRPASRLATDGPFRWSRNPIYVSHVAVVLGLGLLLGSPFTVLLTPLLALGLQKLSIEPEERHLAAKFGEDYRAYMARTRRWL
ncbi:methyltransferase family protein [Methylocystis parvus]|jgi:protein-S-isoprenylcysteine O-methyltransferase Ste14|uniref:methyltransferase family protein n=1 Tax=Methylocystis parvus TaxID=134 RepID=UPI003C72B34E